MKHLTVPHRMFRLRSPLPKVRRWQRRAIAFFLTLLLIGGWHGVEGRLVLAQTETTQTDISQSELSDSDEQALAEVDRLEQQAFQLYQQGRYADAVPLVQQGLEIRERILEANHPDVATSLNNLAALYRVQGNYAQAEPLYQRSLSILETAFGANHPNVALSLNNLAILYQAQGNYAQAEPLYQRSLSIREATFGANHPDVAQSLNNLASLYQAQGNYAQAEPLYQRSLSIDEAAFGANHPDVATSLNNLALLYQEQGNYAEAEPLYQRSLSIREATFGANHPDVATSLNNLALLYQEQGNYAQAEPLYQRSLSILETAFGANHPDVAQSLNNLASLYQAQGNYAQAEPLYQRSLSIREATFGANHPDVATSLNNLALLYQEQGNYAQAEPFYQRSLSILETAFGANHPDVATSLNNLALLYRIQGNYAQAEPLYQRSLSIREATLGANHPDVATSLNNLASLYQAQGNYAQAEPLYQRSLSIDEATLGANHPDVATSLNNLASLYQAQGNYAQAEPFYQRSLSIREAAFGANHPDVATSLNNLASLYQEQGNYAQAEPFYQRSLSIREAAFGANHPDVSQSLNNLAELYQDQGNYAQAEPFYQRSLSILETAFGANHPDVATSLSNLASLYQNQDNPTRALESQQRSLDIEEANLALTLAIGSEARKQAYIATLQGKTHYSVSLHLQALSANPEAADLALTTVLRRKGRILDALTDELQRLRQNLTPPDQELLDQRQSIYAQLSALQSGDLSLRNPEQYRTQVAELEAEAEQISNQLAQRSAEFRVETQPVTLDTIQALIPADAALVELVQYRPVNPGGATASERWGTPRYAAYVLHRQGNPQAVDLGEAAAIDQQIERLRAVLRSPSQSVYQAARQLDESVMQPIRPLLGNSTHLLISPDSQLNLVPFAALVDENDRYLIESYTLTYLTSGRDLLRLQLDTASRQPPVVIANPDYDNAGSTEVAQIPTRSDASGQRGEGGDRRSVDLANLRFGALPGTQTEAEAIAPLLPDVTLLTETQATEAALTRLQAPSILHIATHGFFLQDVECVPAVDTRGNDFSIPRSLILESTGDRQEICRPTESNTENPLLRSGLALAGFNVRQSGGGDGVLTALEATNLNLSGTELVVMSACETGLGDIANGEGVYGLRRAFVMAGAKSQMMSLWKVDDYGTSELMSLYYERLRRGEERSEALRQVQLEFLQAPAYQHPFYWAAFIFSGDWNQMVDL